MKCYLYLTLFSTQYTQATFFSPRINWKYPTVSDFVCRKSTLITMTYSILKSLLYYCKKYNLCSKASVNISANCFMWVSSHHWSLKTEGMSTSPLPVLSSSGFRVTVFEPNSAKGNPRVAGTQSGPHATTEKWGWGSKVWAPVFSF